MRKTLATLIISIPFFTMAKEPFEVNQENCNLPIKTIRKILPNQEQQRKVLQDCLIKAEKEKWKRHKPMQ